MHFIPFSVVYLFFILGMSRESVVTARCGHKDWWEVVPVLSPYQIPLIPSSITLFQTQHSQLFKCPSSANKRVCFFLDSHKELIFILILFYFIFLLDLRVLLLIGPFSRFPSSNLSIVIISTIIFVIFSTQKSSVAFTRASVFFSH